MAEQVSISASTPAQPIPPAESPAGLISADEYMERYSLDSYEWVKGVLIKMTPVSLHHDALTSFLRKLLEAYFVLVPVGKVLGHPFVMRIDATESRREPDLQVILDSNPGQLTDTAMVGPADICIEVVSPESVARDHGEKFAEYEKAGVKEYWIVDPSRRACRFNRLNDEGMYATILPDTGDNYQTPLLPGLLLYVPTLWQDELPDIVAVVNMVQEMLKR